jgi:asparagine synthase (glutamine-hydrolysing)
MPGIVGIISRRPAAECERAVAAMLGSLQHESFYSTGTFSAPDLGVFAGWVALPDAFATGQTFYNESRELALLFSGECFLDRPAHRRLRENGHTFSEKGGDWLLHCYEEQAEKFFENLNGIFSGLLIDRRQNQVFLFNDRYGLDRIYWHETKDAFYFASEAKALLRILPELRQFDPDGVAQFLSVGCALDGRTLFRNVQLLPGGACWRFANGHQQRQTYFSPAAWEQQPRLAAADYEAQLDTTFQQIAPKYFAADSQLGIALTGGLDTRMVMACLPEPLPKPVSYTFTGPTGKNRDDRVAARVAAACGLSHHLLRLAPDFFSDFGAHADKTVFITDGCSGLFGAHEIYFHQLARPLATVRLTGNYGGEILRHVSTFKPLRLAPEMFTATFASKIEAAAQQLLASKKNPDTFAAFQEIPWSLFGNLAAGRSQINFRTPYLDNALVALAYQCPASLKKSSLPAVRFVKKNDRALDAIPTDRGVLSDRTGGFYSLRHAFEEFACKLDYHSDAGLPRKLTSLNPVFRPVVTALGFAGRHKFLKYSTWLRGPLAPLLRERLTAATTTGGGCLAAAFISQLAQSHISGRNNLAAEINAVLTLESIERQLLRGWPRDF